VVALDPEKRADAREQLVLVEGLLDEVVGARFDRSSLLLAGAGGDHDHGEDSRFLALADAAAHGVSVHAGHHDVEEYEVGVRGFDQRECRATVRGRHDLVAARLQDRFEQTDVLGNVVHDENRPTVVHLARLPQCSPTVSTSSPMSTGLGT
jgi:hypothetical protein